MVFDFSLELPTEVKKKKKKKKRKKGPFGISQLKYLFWDSHSDEFFTLRKQSIQMY